MVALPGANRSAHKIVCAQCGVADHITGSASGHGLPDSVAAKKFTQRGWDTRRSLCSDCSTARPTKGAPMSYSNGRGTAAATPVAPMRAEPPRAPTREDNKIIHAKISEVWGGDDVGYLGDWTDEKIAKDLGVPRAWVTDIRVDWFGDVKSNEELRKEITDLTAKLVTASEAYERMAALANRHKSEIDDMRKQLDKIAKKYQV